MPVKWSPELTHVAQDLGLGLLFVIIGITIAYFAGSRAP